MPGQHIKVVSNEHESQYLVTGVTELSNGHQKLNAMSGTELSLIVFDDCLQVIRAGTKIARGVKDEVFVSTLSAFFGLSKLFKLSSDESVILSGDTYLALGRPGFNLVEIIGFFGNVTREGKIINSLDDL